MLSHNCLPTTILSYKSHFKTLFLTKSNNASLQVFGWTYWPNLHHSILINCNLNLNVIFHEYKHLQKEYKCIDFKFGKLYFSSDIIFQESIFPFSDHDTEYSKDPIIIKSTPFFIPIMGSEPTTMQRSFNPSNEPLLDNTHIFSILNLSSYLSQ